MPDGVQETERAVVERVRDCHEAWLPDGPGTGAPVRLTLLSRRPRARMYAVTVGDGAPGPQLLAKVRTDGPTPAGAPAGPSTGAGGGRPTLSSSPLPAAELTALEYAGLQAIAGFAGADSRFGVVRPLAHLQQQGTIVMDFVAEPTLRDELVGRHRLRGLRDAVQRVRGRPRAAGAPDADEACRRAGAWLAHFQEALPMAGRPARQQRRDEVVARFEAYGEFLARRSGDRSSGAVARRGAELAATVLPETLPLAVGHGDFAPRNMFVGAEGRLTVFDPLARWAVPVHEDLARFLAGVRLLGVQVHTHGLALDARQPERWASAVVAGWQDARVDPVPAAAVHCYELLILLDKWSALVAAPATGAKGRARAASTRAAAPYVRAQAVRVAELAERAGP